MKLSDVREWLRSLEAKADHYYCGALDSKRECSIGIYQNKRRADRLVALGRSTKHRVKRVSLLVHWNNNSSDTEQFAQQLYDELCEVGTADIAGAQVSYIELKTDEPIEIGQDDSGVFERVIELDIHYQD